MMPCKAARRQHGFTLIEAIVALVLIGTTGMALFSWINTNIITLNRIQESNLESAATVNVLEYMNNVNPMIQPQGSADLGAYRITWTATASTAPQDGAGYPFGISLYQLALFQTRVTVKKPDGKFWFEFMLQQVGYQKVRENFIP